LLEKAEVAHDRIRIHMIKTFQLLNITSSKQQVLPVVTRKYYQL